MNPIAPPIEFRHGAAGQSQDLLLTCSRTLLSGIASGVLVLRSSGHIAFANETAEGMIGKPTAELTGTTFLSLFEEDLASSRPSDAASGTRRGLLSIGNDGRLPVRVGIRRIQDDRTGMQGSVVTIEDMSDMLQMNEYIKQMMYCDTLTGLPRVETLTAAMDSALMQLHTMGRAFALLELDLDQFRRVRESLGKEAADGALREVASRVRKAIRQGDVVTRNTSDAFTILLTDCSSHADALARAEAIHAVFKEPFRFGPYCTHITASVGMSFSRPGTVTTSGFFTEAELAVRRCKALGGNRVASFDASMADWHSHAVQMETEMQAALANEEFYVVYQPQMCCETGRLVGVESLLRWQSPTHGQIMPDKFIPAAEESGLIVPLGEWCLKTACKEMVGLQQRLGYPVRLAVNVSPKQMYSPGFKEFVRTTLEETGLLPHLLELEITEGLLISHEEEAEKVISSMQELGISVAMDDFGMGFSNLSYINRFKIDRLKIDRSFISRCPSDHNSRMITTSLVFLAKSLGIEVVAEGVETQQQAALLAELRCDLAQGYLYSRPTTVSAIAALAAEAAQSRLAAALAERASGTVRVATAPATTMDAVAAMALPVSRDGAVPGTMPLAEVASQPAAVALSAPGASDAVAVPAAAADQAVAAVVPFATPETALDAGDSVPAMPATMPATMAAVQVAEAMTLTVAADAAAATVAEPAAQSGAVDRAEMSTVERAAARHDESAFPTHRILVPSSTDGTMPMTVPVQSGIKSRRNTLSSAPAIPLEPREPICRPSKPMRAPGAVRVRWTSLPDLEAR